VNCTYSSLKFGRIDVLIDNAGFGLRRLADLGVRLEVVRLLPEPTAPGVDQMVAAIAKAVGDDRAGTLLVGHSVGGRTTRPPGPADQRGQVVGRAGRFGAPHARCGPLHDDHRAPGRRHDPSGGRP